MYRANKMPTRRVPTVGTGEMLADIRKVIDHEGLDYADNLPNK